MCVCVCVCERERVCDWTLEEFDTPTGAVPEGHVRVESGVRACVCACVRGRVCL